jgi:hypothetical protein
MGSQVIPIGLVELPTGFHSASLAPKFPQVGVYFVDQLAERVADESTALHVKAEAVLS